VEKIKVPELLLNYIKNSEKIMLFTHVRPDGDALGSLFGLSAILHEMGKDVVCCVEKEIPPVYAFLPQSSPLIIGSEELQNTVFNPDDYLGISLDAGDLPRLGEFADIYLQLTRTFAIDHHKSHEPFGDGRWVEAGVSSTGELVFELAGELGAHINLAAATNLYVAIVTDTGGFRYECTGPRTHAVAGELIACGVRPEVVGMLLYDNWSVERLQLLRLVLSTLDVSGCGQIASVYVDQDMLNESGGTMEDTDGFVDYLRSIGTVKVAIFIKDNGNGVISISLRAKGECDVAVIAQKFGGGGHRNAAGFRLSELTVKEARIQVVEALENFLS